MTLKAEATSINKRLQLPSLHIFQQEPIQFTSEDITKIIDQLVTKGLRFTNFKKTLSFEEINNLHMKLLNSNFIKIIIRKTIIKMAQQRRIGNGLRGFSKLLLDEIQAQCWSLILIQKSLFDLNKRQQKQMNLLANIFRQNSSE